MIMTDERFMAFMISKCSLLRMKDPKSAIRVLKISILRFDIDLDNVLGDLLSHMPTIMLAFHHLSRNCTKSYCESLDSCNMWNLKVYLFLQLRKWVFVENVLNWNHDLLHGKLIKATEALEYLNMKFNSLFLLRTHNKQLPFVIPCEDSFCCIKLPPVGQSLLIYKARPILNEM